MLRLTSAVLLLVASLAAAPKPAPKGHAFNHSTDIDAVLYVDREAIKELLGSDLGGYYVVVEVKLKPRVKLKVERDDFMLRTDRDGERTKPFQPSQIAGRGALVVSQTGAGGAVMGENRGPVWGGGGYPGGGRPQQLPGNQTGIGNSSSEVTNESRVDHGDKKKEDPLLGKLAEKMLAEKETEEPISGLLYFPLEPKQKAKDLELTFTSPNGKLSVRFK